MMNVFYEKEEFIRNRVPIRLFLHYYKDDRIFTPIHWHRCLEINLTLVGEIIQCINGNYMACGPGDLCIVNSGMIHSNYSKGQQPEIQMITLQISIAFLENWLGENMVFCLPEHNREREEIKKIILKIVQESTELKAHHELRQIELIFRLLVLLSRSCIKKDTENRRQKEGGQRFKDVLDYIEKHYQEELSLDMLADKFGYSSAYLSRSFKRHIGYNFSRHLQVVRMNATIEDMGKNPEKSILNCATEHGFPNIKSFIHIFKREYGCTPSEWRKENGRKESKVLAVYVDSIPEGYADILDTF